MINQVDFSKLKPYKTDKKKSFELLCYHIALREYDGTGKFTPVDDSGGGDGVEFYLTLPNGDQWGWQAKFFTDTDRLAHGGRKNQIITSLETACKHHPNLKKWFLCTPSNFTPDEQTWFKDELPKKVPASFTSKPEIIHWHSNYFNSCFANLKFSGITNFFFGTLELSLDWFRRKFDENFKTVESKYDPELHSEHGYVNSTLDQALINSNFLFRWEMSKKKFNDSEEDYIEKLKIISSLTGLSANEEALKGQYIAVCNNISTWINDMWKDIDLLNQFFSEKKVNELRKYPHREKFKALSDLADTLDKIELDNKSTTYDKFFSLRIAANSVGNSIEEFFYYNFDFTNRNITILGGANSGKTHIACDYSKKIIDDGYPVIFIPAIRFSNKTGIEQGLKDILDIPVQYSIDDFFNCLDVCARIFECRIPIIIEGLNETTINGQGFSDIWKNNISAFKSKVLAHQNLVLITTCRPGYFEEIWGTETLADCDIQGFYDTHDAIEKYFKKYRIKADLTFTSIEHFSHPIYLKLFCEIKNPGAKNPNFTEVTIGEENLTDIFEKYLTTVNEAIISKYKLSKSSNIVKPSLLKIANYLWINNERALPIKTFYEIVDTDSPIPNQPLSDILLNEGLLFISDWINKSEVTRFTYDPLAGYLIAEELINKNLENRNAFIFKIRTLVFNSILFFKISPYSKFALLISSKIKRFVNSDLAQEKVFASNFRKLHTLSQDISKFLALLLPKIEGRHLYNLSDKKEITNLSISSFFDLPKNYISKEEIEYVEALISREVNWKPFFHLFQKTIPLTEHPFNIKFFSNFLSSMSIANRDLNWTEYVRKRSYELQSYVLQFESSCKETEVHSLVVENRTHLIAEYLMWFLPSTNRNFRDKVTRALYFYGIRYPVPLMDLAEKSLKINDPYISERLIAALYGAVLACESKMPNKDFIDNKLPSIGLKVYDLIFKPNAEFSTTHILKRDYARRIIELSLKYKPDLLTANQIVRIRPPYKDGGIRDWPTYPDEFTGSMFGGPINMDFGNYTIGYIVKDGHSYTNSEDKIKTRGHIYWRIYNLGWSKKLFEKVDDHVMETTYPISRGSRPKVERYGKKYSWIAFFEVAGYRADLGLLDDEWPKTRISSADIDPTFPVAISQHQLVKDDFLGDRSQNVGAWVKDGGIPDFINYLKFNNLQEMAGDWICLDSYINQTDKEADRCRSTFFRSILVKENDYKRVSELLKEEDLHGRPLPELRENYYTFFNELISFPELAYENWVDLEFVTKREKVKVKKGDPGYYPDYSLFNEEGEINLTPTFPIEREIESRTVESFEVLFPVMEYRWERDSDEESTSSAQLLSAEIIKYLDLISKPQSLDLYSKNGEKISQVFKSGGDYKDSEHFIYMRKDFFDKFLFESKLKLIWVIWGERRKEHYESHETHKKFYEQHGVETIKTFYQVLHYDKVF